MSFDSPNDDQARLKKRHVSEVRINKRIDFEKWGTAGMDNMLQVKQARDSGGKLSDDEYSVTFTDSDAAAWYSIFCLCCAGLTGKKSLRTLTTTARVKTHQPAAKVLPVNHKTKHSTFFDYSVTDVYCSVLYFVFWSPSAAIVTSPQD